MSTTATTTTTSVNLEHIAEQEQEIDQQLSQIELLNSLVDSPINLLKRNLNNLLISTLLIIFVVFCSACDAKLLGVPLIAVVLREIIHAAIVTHKIRVGDVVLICVTLGLAVSLTQVHMLGAFQFVAVYTLLIIPEYAIKAAAENYSALEDPFRVKILRAFCTPVPHLVVCMLSIALTRGGFFFEMISLVVSLSNMALIMSRAVKLTWLSGDGATASSEQLLVAANTSSSTAAIALEVLGPREELKVAPRQIDEGEGEGKVEQQQQQQHAQSDNKSLVDSKIIQAALRLREKQQMLAQKLAERSPCVFNIYRKLTNYNLISVLFFVMVVIQTVNVTKYSTYYELVPDLESYIVQVKVPRRKMYNNNNNNNNKYNKYNTNNNNFNNNNNNNYNNNNNNFNNKYNNNNNNNNNNYNANEGNNEIDYRWTNEWRTRTVYRQRLSTPWKIRVAKTFLPALLLFPALLLYCLEALVAQILPSFSPLLSSSSSSTSSSSTCSVSPAAVQTFNNNRIKRMILLGIAFLLILPSEWPTFTTGFILAASMPFVIYRDTVSSLLLLSATPANDINNNNNSIGDDDDDDNKTVSSSLGSKIMNAELLYEKLRSDFVLSFVITGFALHHLPNANFNAAFFITMITHAGLSFALFKSLGRKLF